jgi:hypothetical protein
LREKKNISEKTQLNIWRNNMKKISIAICALAVFCFAGFAQADDRMALMQNLGVADAQILSNDDMNQIRGTATYYVRIDSLIEGWDSYYYDYGQGQLYNTGLKLLNNMHIVGSSGSPGINYDAYVNDQNHSQVLFYVYKDQNDPTGIKFVNQQYIYANLNEGLLVDEYSAPKILVVDPTYIFPVEYLVYGVSNSATGQWQYRYNPYTAPATATDGNGGYKTFYGTSSTSNGTKNNFIDQRLFATYMITNAPYTDGNSAMANSWVAPLTGAQAWNYANWAGSTQSFYANGSRPANAQFSMRDQYRTVHPETGNNPVFYRSGYGYVQ